MSTRGYRVVYDEDVRRVVANLPTTGKRSLAELLRELTKDARLGIGPVGQEVAYASGHDLLVAYRVDHGARLIEVLSLVWLSTS